MISGDWFERTGRWQESENARVCSSEQSTRYHEDSALALAEGCAPSDLWDPIFHVSLRICSVP